MAMNVVSRSKCVRAAAVICACTLITGCATEDIALEGKIFEMAGLSGGSSTRDVPELERRAPIVVPPTTASLPAPGTRPAAPHDALAGINDPDEVQKISRADLERQQKEFCDKHYSETIHGAGEDAVGPLGSCRKSIFSALKKWNNGE